MVMGEQRGSVDKGSSATSYARNWLLMEFLQVGSTKTSFFFFLVLYKRECSRGNGNQWELRAQRSFGRDLVISPVQRDCM